jgi:hypothetical protein
MALGYPAMKDPSTSGPRWILHPTLIAAAFVLEIALANKIEPAGFARALAVAVLVGIGLTLACWAATRDRWLAGLVATFLTFATISIIPFFFAWEGLRRTLGPTVTVVAFALVLSVIIGLPAAQAIRVRRGADPIRGPATSFLNRYGGILLIVMVAFHVGPDVPGQIADVLTPRQKVAVKPVAEPPDIYVILLDGYPRADVLDRKFGIDDTPFLDALEGLGFDVGTENHSNYVFTQLTLASVFQMRHLEDVPTLAPLIGLPGAHVNALRNAMIESPAFAALRAGGYQIVVTQPGYEHVALRGAADRVLEHGEMNDLERDVLKRTWLLDPLGAIFPTLFTGPPRDRTVHAFDDLQRLASESRSEPIFAWVHVPAPHLPLVMDAGGRALELSPRLFDGTSAIGFQMTDARFAADYANEIEYLNTRVLGAVRALAAPSGRPDPVIVIMSDHGYNTDLADPQARLSNLFAAYTPTAPGLLADSPTPVNLMTILLNRFLGTDYPMSADRYFLSPSNYQLLELTEVPNPN